MMDEGRIGRGVGTARIVLAVATVALGLVLLFAGLSLPVFVSLCGAGLIVIGVSFGVAEGARRSLGVVAAVVCVATGLVVLLWHAASVRTLVMVIAGTLVVHGVLVAVHALRGGADGRAAGLLGGGAGAVFGLVCLSWPVLTIELFRVGLGAWLVFTGLRSLPFPRRDRPATTRRWVRTLVAAGAFVLAVVLALGGSILLRGDQRPAPDAFYTPPASVPDQPGKLLRAEPLDSVTAKGGVAWRILYTTTTPDDSPSVASGTVIAPRDRGKKPLPLLSVAHGTTGVTPRCAPSLSRTPFADGAETALFEMVTKHGWAAVVSDYAGLGTAGPHPYLVGEAEARNVLDASRAARQLDDLTLSDDTVVWGHSQGGHAALWTGQLATGYAPDLHVKGIAALAPATDLHALAEAGKGDIGGKTVSAYIAESWHEVYPDLDLMAQLTPGTAHGVEQIARLCFNQRDAIAALLRGTQVPEQVFPDDLLDGELGDLLRRNTPTGPFPAPVLVAQGLADPLVRPGMQHDWVRRRCETGQPIDYRTFEGRGHVELVAGDSPLTPQLVDWTLARWAGQPPTPNCDALPGH